MKDARQRLLDAAVRHLAEHGLTDLSLRGLATALGTSHRMVIYHFGSKEGLLVEVIRAVEQQQRDAFADLYSAGSPPEVIREFWRRLSDPELWPHERLFFEIYGQALQGRPGTTALLDGVVENCLEQGVLAAEHWGLDPATARAEARLGLAVVRGLLLDLLATGDREGTTAALERFAAGFERE
ncbi:TetR/AcrR family transcriptional regulator [Allokutzneria sp. A3M-2-11 16]|uniref:TetR/AcrR family transcriptional regulator n=1 Tax=Allokutzneria sp. A3M-2-11 16 TaxID=2962043 RepID=UPI0020B80FC9|nr:TetR/AcrR family transcriptional regulator [Allokutzneria sp. A3M-2-11 16]MCP3801077.1 TetR/AcrR family transcriptional regulator [Allokutzneria sp. A3M-2-11 16]